MLVASEWILRGYSSALRDNNYGPARKQTRKRPQPQTTIEQIGAHCPMCAHLGHRLYSCLRTVTSPVSLEIEYTTRNTLRLDIYARKGGSKRCTRKRFASRARM